MFRLAFTISFLLLCLNAQCQASNNLKKVLSRIKSIPTWYTKDYTYEVNNKNFENIDSTYQVIAKMDTMALYRLWAALSDTTLTGIPNPCDSSNLTYGQLAFLLINDIEHVPYALVTKLQWCTWGECGALPDGFLSYIKEHPREFEEKYRLYLGSRERQKYLRDLRRANKKIRRS